MDGAPEAQEPYHLYRQLIKEKPVLSTHLFMEPISGVVPDAQ